jgi:anti-anti-sigma factor
MGDLNDLTQFEITVVDRGTDTPIVLELRGDLDLDSAGILADRVGDLLARGVHGLHIDCAGVSFVDSSGLKALLDADRQATGRGIPFRVVSASEQLRELVAMTGTAELLPGV